MHLHAAATLLRAVLLYKSSALRVAHVLVHKAFLHVYQHVVRGWVRIVVLEIVVNGLSGTTSTSELSGLIGSVARL